jgi:hypothetical protein
MMTDVIIFSKTRAIDKRKENIDLKAILFSSQHKDQISFLK